MAMWDCNPIATLAAAQEGRFCFDQEPHPPPTLYNSLSLMARPASKKTVGIVSKPNKPEVAQILPGLIEWLHTRGHALLVDPETAPHAGNLRTVSRLEMGEQDLDYVIVLGGDGTFLSAARAVAKAGIPIVGVNLGALGFLTEVPIEDRKSVV